MTVVATAGHVDHGKSSLVLALTGTDPDRFEEEKRRGLTIDLGFAHTTLPSGAELSFVDVPGHVRFLRNMLAGVGGVAACVFVVAATEGWKPQSEEHLRILELLGLHRGLIVLTKVDLVDADTLEIARMDVADHVAGTFLAEAPVIAASSTSGLGLDELRQALDALVADLVAEQMAQLDDAATDRRRPRLWIDRVFSPRGSGTVVTGTLVGGPFEVEDIVAIEPGGREARIRGLQTAGRALEVVEPGNRVAINLSGVDQHDLARGDAVIRPGQWRPSARLDCSLDVLAELDHDVSRRGSYVAYLGSGEHHVSMRVLGGEAIPPGGSGTVRLHLPDALPVLPGDRYILRETGREETIGGGEILDIDPVLRAADASPDRSIERVVRERGGWVEATELELLTGQAVEPVLGTWVTTTASIDSLAASITERVEQAGPGGIDLAAFDERERAVIAVADGVVVDAGLVRPAGAVDPFANHPFLDALRAGGYTPPPPDGVDRSDLRELVRRGHAVQRDGIVFHADTIERAAREAARLLADSPEGFTVAQVRDATGASRKYVLPLLAELDASGVTRRRDDLRIAGPRLPDR